MTMELEKSLNDYLDSETPLTADGQGGYIIDTADKADWAPSKIASFQNEIKQAVELKEKRIQQFNRWCEKETQDLQNQITYFESLLLPYADSQLKDSKKKSLSLPNGVVGFRKSGDKFTIDGEVLDKNNEKLTKWLKEHNPKFVITKETSNWSELKKTLKVTKDGKTITADGEIIENVKAEVGESVFYAKVGD